MWEGEEAVRILGGDLVMVLRRAAQEVEGWSSVGDTISRGSIKFRWHLFGVYVWVLRGVVFPGLVPSFSLFPVFHDVDSGFFSDFCSHCHDVLTTCMGTSSHGPELSGHSYAKLTG